MAMKKMSKYTFSLALTILSLSTWAQKADWHGLSLGADLSRIVVPFLDSTRLGWEVSGDYEITKDLFGCVEIGSQTTHLNAPNYNYSSSGAYTRLGVDYNYMKHVDDKSPDQLLIGLRYGFTTFFHEANNIVVKNDVWGNMENGSIERNWLSANWMEIVTGMRAHLFNNFYLGWSARFRVKLWFQDDPKMQPYYIPGYGRGWNSSWIGFNYSLYYKIPIVKKRTPKVSDETNKENKADQTD